jgi:hypothetical protein
MTLLSVCLIASPTGLMTIFYRFTTLGALSFIIAAGPR